MFTKLSSSSTMAYPSPLILAVVLFVALFVSSAFSRHAPPPPDITSLCAQTPDPETCENSFIQNSKYYFSSSDHLTNQKLNLNVLGLISIRLDLLVPTASRAADDTLNIASNVKPSHRAKTAWNDCAKLTKACVRDLLDIGDPRATRCAADVEARLSAARTRLDTCHDGLKEAGQGGDSLLPSTINIVITLISQALASIVKVHPIIGPTNRHKGSFPTWVSPRDRKLLQAPAPPTSPVTTPPTTPSAPPPNTLTPPPPPPPPLTPTTNNIVVAKDGTGHFTTIGEAVAYASLVSNGLSRIVIYIKGGEYVENVEITRDAMNIMFVGDGIGNTIITGSRSVGGTPGMTTFQSATVGFSRQHPPKSDIKSWCAETPHPKTCEYFFTHSPKYSSPIKGKPDFLKKSLLIALERAVRAAADTYRLGSKLKNPREKAAWYDCLELYDIAIQNMNEIVNPHTKCSDKDAQTWLSTALTNIETCKQGFTEVGEADYMLPTLSSDSYNVSSLISNTLAVNNVPFSEPIYQGGFPNWVSPGDRKLLQAGAVPSPVVIIRPNFVVAKDGSGNFTTVGAAVAAASKIANNVTRTVIYIKAGTYSESVEIGKKVRNIMFVGDGIGKTIITGSKSVAGSGTTTFRSATVAAVGPGFIARGITFRNTAGPQNHQAVAFRSDSDYSVFYQCSFEGYQDTLYAHSNRQFYRDCNIYGTVDYIFGNAAVVFQNCTLYSRNPPNKINTITAQGRIDKNQNTGISIHNSRILAAPDLAPVQGSVKTYLGRPWKQYSRTVVMKSYMGSLIDPAGWLPWNGDFALSTLYYGEYANTGPGSATGGRVKWGGYRPTMTPAEASKFTVTGLIGGSSWLPGTNVTFNSDL
ncbi:OLC1v1002176C1 [Oldenlandia corymbosa var. corymbosa]|uniref:pectinesterase n=1 Tax=Oldenlandia corymbosa var. corymbosa TaxID=529605 RepID=A0AAV1D9X4_OLDCO|nr:OLC1v1002176C1 [Oldenlandia corymbosa var. corymbosa]